MVLRMTEMDSRFSESATARDYGASSNGHASLYQVSLIGVLAQLSRHKWSIAKATAFALIAGIATSIIAPVRYTAATKIMPPHETPSVASMLVSQMAGSGTGSLAAVASGGLGLRNPNDIYVDLLKSRPVADALIQEFGLIGEYRSPDMTAARKKLAERTAIISEKSGLIVISVTDGDKVKAASIANAYADQLRSLTKTLAVTEASQRVLFYEEQLKHAKDDLVSAELVYQEVQRKSGLVQLDAQAKSVIESLAALRAEVAAKQVEVQALRSFSTGRNPDLQLAEQQLFSLQGEAARMEHPNRSSVIGNLGLEDVPGAGMDYLRAQHEVAYRQGLFDLLIKQYDAARMDESKDAAVIQVVEAAIPADRRTSPHRAMIVLLFPMIGIVGACAFSLLNDYIQRNKEISGALSELRAALVGK